MRYVQSGKISRWLRRPYRHLIGLGQSYFVYRFTHAASTRTCRLFTGRKFRVPLPAGLDIYLTGAKSHDSELRLTSYLIKNVRSDWSVFDIGAHVGYYSAVIAALLDGEGGIHAFEPSPDSYACLKRNLAHDDNVATHQCAVSQENGMIDLMQFPTKYSEYDSIVRDAAEAELKDMARLIPVKTRTIDTLCSNLECHPDIIKIDVEGAELRVLEGARGLLKDFRPKLVLEIRKDAYDTLYAPVHALLGEFGYGAMQIAADGSTKPIPDLGKYIADLPLESDNVLFE